MGAVGHIFRYAIAYGYAELNPASDIKPSDVLESTRKMNYARIRAKDLLCVGSTALVLLAIRHPGLWPRLFCVGPLALKTSGGIGSELDRTVSYQLSGERWSRPGRIRWKGYRTQRMDTAQSSF